MEVLLVPGCGLIAWVCAFVCTGRGTSGSSGSSVGTNRMTRSAESFCGRLGETALVRWLSALEPWRRVAGELSERLRVAGMRLDGHAASAALLATCSLASLATAVLSWAWAGTFVGIAASAAVVAGCNASLVRKRRLGLAQEMPGAFRTLATALGSGQTMAQAIEHIGSRGRGYASESFSRAALMLRCGSSVEEALGLIERELAAPGVGMLTTALRVSHRTGSPLRDLFTRSARLVERTSEFERLLAVKTAQVRLSVKIVCVLPAALVALLSVISPDFRSGLATPAGMGSVAVAAVMDGLALLVVRRLVRKVI